MTVVRKLSEKELWFKKGEQSFRSGRPNIENTWTEEEWRESPNIGQCFWLGWMFARAQSIMMGINSDNKRDAIRNYIEHGIDIPDRFK